MPEKAVELLLVEDNPDDVEMTLHVLKKNNISNSIKVVRDGAEALEYLLGAEGYLAPSYSPKVVMLDLKLPKVNGIEVLARIRSDPRTRSLPVVVLTSSREDSDLSRCYQLGVNSYIVKPVDFNQFNEAIRQLGLYWLLLNEIPTSAAREPQKEYPLDS
jgi:two-component system, response regulator